MEKRLEKYIKFLMYLIAIVLINIAGITFFFRVDLTKNKIYSLSEASKQAVSGLSEPLTINVFFTKELPAPYNNTERYLRDLLQEYSVHANKYFNYRFYDVSPEKESNISQKTQRNQELAKNYGIYPVQIQVIEKDEVKFQKAYMGLVLIHGDLVERIPTITSTDGLEYKLTTAIKKLNDKISVLLGLPEKIQVKLFLSSSLESVAPFMGLPSLPELPEKLKETVDKLNRKNYEKLEFIHLDPTKDIDVQDEIEKYNILSLKWPAFSEKQIQSGEGVIGLVLKYMDKVIEIPLMHVIQIPLIGKHYELIDMAEMEEIINEGIESLIDINEDLGFLADHGTINIWNRSSVYATESESLNSASNFRALISEGYTIKPINLKNETIPSSLNCLVIAGPTEIFTDYELFQIDQFLMQGKSLALFLDAFKEKDPSESQSAGYGQSPSYVSLDTGIEKLLEHYGIRINKSYVMDKNCYKQRIPAQFGGGERPIYFAPLINKNFINNELAFMQNIKELIVAKISPLYLDAERIKENSLNAHRLFASSEESWEIKDRIDLNPMLIQPPRSDDENQSRSLAYIIEGEFPSYFAGKSIPKKTTSKEKDTNEPNSTVNKETIDIDLSKIEGKREIISKGKPGKIFLMASSEMLKDNMLDAEGRSPNAIFVMNVLDFLNNREAIAIMRSKDQSPNPLNETGSGTKTFIKSFNIIGLPVFVVISGLLVWSHRISRKKRIQMMFKKSEASKSNRLNLNMEKAK